MCDDKKLQFTCQECGAHELGYQKYAKCIAPVSLKENGGVEYGCSEIDENDYLCAEDGFICMNCEAFVEHCGWRIETENQLIDYLTMDPQVREQEEKEYEGYVDAEVCAQEQKEEEQAAVSASMES